MEILRCQTCRQRVATVGGVYRGEPFHLCRVCAAAVERLLLIPAGTARSCHRPLPAVRRPRPLPGQMSLFEK